MLSRVALSSAFALLTALLASPGRADTVVPGGVLPTATTWTFVGSPYVVLGDVVVPGGGTLTVEPGVSVRFAGSDAQGTGVDPARVEISVQGSLLVQGTLQAPVTLRAQLGTSANTWYGIVIQAGASQVSIQHAILEHASQAVRTSAASGVVYLDSITLDNNGFDISVAAGAVTPTIVGTLTAGRFLGNFTLTPPAILSLNRISGVVQAGNLSLPVTSLLRPTLSSVASYEKLAITGSVALGAQLDLDVAALVASPGDSFTLLDNDAADAVSGTFAGLPEGTAFDAGSHRFRISYVGGSGNDVTLLVVPNAQIPVLPPAGLWLLGAMLALSAALAAGART